MVPDPWGVGVRAGAAVARDGAGALPPRGVVNGPAGVVLPRLVPVVGLPLRAVHPHPRHVLLRGVRVRGDQPRGRGGGVGEGVQGVPARGLLPLAAAEGCGLEHVEADRELHRRRQALRRARRRGRVQGQRVLQAESLAHSGIYSLINSLLHV